MDTSRSAVPVPAHLPPTAAQTTPENPWPLHLLSAKIEEYVARMSRIWVEGEVITYNPRPGAKIQYFTLSDLNEPAAMTVKIFTHNLRFALTSGARIIICAKPDFWKGNGSLTLMADEIRPVGTGDILARIEQLKAKLRAEGLFDASRKKPLPFLPRKIGLICGRNTDAKRDVVVNARKRWAGADFEIREVQIQGGRAVDEMLGALHELERIPDVDVIVFARGGGSVEDLLPFSEEKLLRAAAAAKTPIVSAIGHEADTPVLDFVADVRASTPTDAAKRIVPSMEEEREGIKNALMRGRKHLRYLIGEQRSQLRFMREKPVLSRPGEMLTLRQNDLTALHRALRSDTAQKIKLETSQSEALLQRLRTLSPQSTLNRGYSILRNRNKKLIRSINDIESNKTLEAIVADGTVQLEISVSDIRS